MIAARAVIAGFIAAHEGGLSMHASDNGNWYSPTRFEAGLPQRRGEGGLVGSKFGVTAYALVRFRLRLGQPRAKALVVTPRDIAAIGRELAISIGVELYLHEPRIDALVWNRVTASILDKAWGSGPDRAIRMLQQLLGVIVDGQIGPKTIAQYGAWLTAVGGEEEAAHRWCEARIAFDQSLVTGPADPDRAFVAGWNNRSRSFLPGTPWWRKAGAP